MTYKVKVSIKRTWGIKTQEDQQGQKDQKDEEDPEDQEDTHQSQYGMCVQFINKGQKKAYLY